MSVPPLTIALPQAWNNVNLQRLAEKIKSPLVLCVAPRLTSSRTTMLTRFA